MIKLIYQAIHGLNIDCLGYEYDIEATKHQLASILSSPFYQIFVAEAAGKVVGYVHASHYDNTYSKPLKNIMGIAVMPTMQGKGIGRSLIYAVESWAKAENCAGVRLVSGLNREAAHIFYKHCGYIQRKEQINFIKWF